jgi:hypothetical protein
MLIVGHDGGILVRLGTLQTVNRIFKRRENVNFIWQTMQQSPLYALSCEISVGVE